MIRQQCRAEVKQVVGVNGRQPISCSHVFFVFSEAQHLIRLDELSVLGG